MWKHVKIKYGGPVRGAERTPSETACLNGVLEDVAAAWHRGRSCSTEQSTLFFCSINIWLIVLQQCVCTGTIMQ